MKARSQQPGGVDSILDVEGAQLAQESFRFEPLTDGARSFLDSGRDASAVDLFTLIPSTHRSYPKGVELLPEGIIPPVVAVIRRGYIKIVRVSPSGRERILALHTPPMLIGAAEVVVGQPLAAAVITAGPCEIDEVTRSQFLSVVRVSSAALWSLQRHLAWEACTLRSRAAELHTLSPRQLLQSTLAQFVPPDKERMRDVRLSLPITHRELAQMVGVTPEHLCRLLRELESESLITRNRGWIILRDVRKFVTDW